MGLRYLEFTVGAFMVAGLLALGVLAFEVSGLSDWEDRATYPVHAEFLDIGDLKVRAPITIAGVVIGRVKAIRLNSQTFRASVTMAIEKHHGSIPNDSTANIYTAGLIGSNYISLTPGFSDTFLKGGDTLANTNQAMILQNIIGQLLFSMNHSGTTAKS